MEKLENSEKLENYTGVCGVWDFRANEDYFTADALKSFFTANCKSWLFQKEKGDSGYIHWQGRFKLIKKRNKSTILKLFDAIGKAPNYLVPTSKENHLDEFFYCMKADTRVGDEIYGDEQYSRKLNLVDGIFIPWHLKNIKLYPYQQEILDSSKNRDSRTVNLLFDYEGNKGRSTISSIGELLHGCIDMPVLYDSKDIIQTACDICMHKNMRSPPIFFFDMPRSMRKGGLEEFYTAVEQIKKGKLYDIRYSYKEYWIDSPTIWVFSNSLPSLELLSHDRWKFWRIDKDNKLELVPKDTIASLLGRREKQHDDL